MKIRASWRRPRWRPSWARALPGAQVQLDPALDPYKPTSGVSGNI